MGCECKLGYAGSGEWGDCRDVCQDRCRNQGTCLKDKAGNPYCQCVGSFTGDDCETKSEFAYIAGGIAGAIIFLILLVLLVWTREQRWVTREQQTSTTGLRLRMRRVSPPATTAPTPTTTMTRRTAGTCPTSTMRD